MTGSVRVDTAILSGLGSAIAQHAADSAQAMAGAHRAAEQAHAQIRSELGRRRVELARARAALEACMAGEEPRCGAEQAAVADAERRVEQAEAALRTAEAGLRAFAPRRARFDREIRTLASDAGRLLTLIAQDLDAYLRGATASGLGGAAVGGSGVSIGGAAGGPSAGADVGGIGHSGAASGSLSTPAGFPDGWAMVPLAQVNASTDDPGSWHQDVKPSDLEWGLSALEEVVLPAMARGLGADYFQSRDQADGERRGSRSYSDTYSGFFGLSEAIQLHPQPDGTFNIGNGRHRIWVAEQLGMASIPAKIS